MIKRQKTKTVKVGSVRIGSRYPVVIQSMTKTDTTDIDKTLRQIKALASAGAHLVRIAVPTKHDTQAFAKIVEKSPIPLVADIHFSSARAIEAIQAGAAKVRLNPGNIKNKRDIINIIDCAKVHKTAIRIGVNEASIRDLKAADIPVSKRVALMLKGMKSYVRLFEKQGFDNIVLSAKSADTIRTIEVNRAISKTFDYPIHLGLTHAGLPADAIIPSSIAVGTLLAEGIGDTIRISLAGNPVKEIEAAKQILSSLELYKTNQPQLIVCPTCGRCGIDVVKLAAQVKKVLKNIESPIKVAVMGCIVNGPGEAADADIAICAAKSKGFIYKKGLKIKTVSEKQLLTELKKLLEKL